MNVKLKMSVYFAVTLLLGIFIGVLISHSVMHHREEGFRKRIEEHGIEKFIVDRVIRPDDNQREQVEKIIKRYAPKFEEARETNMKVMDSLIDSALTELKPVLTEEQLERISRRPPDPFMPRKGRRR